MKMIIKGIEYNDNPFETTGEAYAWLVLSAAIVLCGVWVACTAVCHMARMLVRLFL